MLVKVLGEYMVNNYNNYINENDKNTDYTLNEHARVAILKAIDARLTKGK